MQKTWKTLRIKQQGYKIYCRKWESKKKVCYYKAKTRKLEADKAKNIESDPSLLLKLEDLKEQVKFLENEKLLLKEQLDNFKSSKSC